MQLILDIDESQKDIVLNIIKNLKEGIIKNYTLKDSIPNSNVEIVSYEEEQEIRKILENMTEDDKQVVDSRKYTIDL